MVDVVIDKTDIEIKAAIEKMADVTVEAVDLNHLTADGYTDKNGSTGTVGQVLTAVGDGTCEWT